MEQKPERRRHKLEKEFIREPYTQMIEVVNKNTISKFIRPEWHRDFREIHIKHIQKSLLQGVHFSETITVNELRDKYVIINGNHRIEAIRRVIQEFPDFSIEVRLTKYHSLSEERELEIYTIVNKVRPESYLDRIKAHCINSEFVKLTSKNFPVRIMFRSVHKDEVNSLPITMVVSPYLNRNNKNFGTGSALIKQINEMDEDDVDRIKAFLLFYKEVFGEITKSNLYADPYIVGAVGKVYYNSVGVEMSKEQFRNKLQVIKQRYTGDLMYFKGQGMRGAKDLYLFLLDKIKVGKPLFNVFEVEEDAKKASA